ncbi:MAG: LemA family protein [Deltaproteobacteria bacterium]|nr:LemA family protein [Deltaproteobacteria bacterium]
MKKSVIFLVTVVMIFLLVLLGLVLTYNSMVSKDQAVKEGWSNIQVQYQRRIDLIPQVISAVNSSMTFERDLLENITVLRTQWLDSISGNIPVNVNTTQQLDARINALLIAINENYPELKSVEVVRDFITVVEGTENRIAAERIFYNDAVRSYNTAINSFPGNLVAGMFGFEDAPYYELGQ